MKWFHWLFFLLIIAAYLILRIGWQQTIEFGYDQPRLASVVLDFAKNVNFWDLQKYSLESPWGNLSWGPALVIFFLPFLYFSPNPINASLLIAIFNLLSVIFVVLIGKKYFSIRAGLIAGLVLSLHPWWIIFSRMIYQPTPIPTFIIISIYLLFKSIEKPNSFWIGTLIFSWAVLLQMYLITFSFVLTSFIILAIRVWKKKINPLFIGLGLLSVLILFLPSIKYYLEFPEMFNRFFGTSGKFSSSPLEVLINFIQVISGAGFVWQLGYGYKSFISEFSGAMTFIILTTALIGTLILYGFIKIFKSKNIYGISLILFLLAPLWAIPMIGVEYIVPRYFLYILPPFSLILAISLDEFIKKAGKISFIIPFLIFSWWTIFTFKYFNFVENYSYGAGFLSHFSDVPYSFLQKSFDWIENDAKQKAYSNFTVSNDPGFPYEMRLNWAQSFYWKYLFKTKAYKGSGNQGHYLMYFSPAPEGVGYKQFGPYVVYESTGFKN